MTHPDSPARASTRALHRRWPQRIAILAGLLFVALATTWTIAHMVPVTVRSAEAMRSVAFGWPIPWYHQDFSRYASSDYPTVVRIIGDRVAPLPTTVDWLALAGNVALTALALWALVATLLLFFGPMLRRTLAARQRSAG